MERVRREAIMARQREFQADFDEILRKSDVDYYNAKALLYGWPLKVYPPRR
jgi:hypothetical protein